MASSSSSSTQATGNHPQILQLKISLREIKPKIWRRIQMKSTDNFEDLHRFIQAAMGWRSTHLHEFITKDKQRIVDLGYENISGFDADEPIKGDQIKLSAVFNEPKDKVRYIYDFGNDWIHDVVLEKILPVIEGESYPKCVGGKRACPPEDCGGSSGYEELLEVYADPSHSEYEDLITEWLFRLYPDYDPEVFTA